MFNFAASETDAKKWLIKIKANGEKFGVADTICLEVLQLNGKMHIVNATKNKTWCGRTSSTSTVKTTYTDLYLQTYDTKKLCETCDNNCTYSNVNLGIWEEFLEEMMDVCIYAEKIQITPPKKYSAGWENAIKALNVLDSLMSTSYGEGQNLLTSSMSTAEEIIKAYLAKNKADQTNENFLANVILHSKLCTLPKELDFLTTLNINTKEFFSEATKISIRQYLQQNSKIINVLEYIPEITKLDKNNYLNFKEWALAEAIENKATQLEALHKKYLQQLKTLVDSAKGPYNHLVKLEYKKEIFNHYNVAMYFYMLNELNSSSSNNGILVSVNLVKMLKRANAWPENLQSLGLVTSKDTPEILETALGLNLPVGKALKAARLLHKEK